jgi:hypothetical protein
MKAVCPYCRAQVDPEGENGMLCPGCGTPHHADCFEENGGCTVFGCSSAPADEPKVRLSDGDIEAATMPQERSIEYAVRTPAPPPPRLGQPSEPESRSEAVPFTGTSLLFGSPAEKVAPQQTGQAEPVWAVEGDSKKRMTFITLGILMGFLGVHNFYAGYRGKGLAQLLITVLSMGFASPMTWIWAIIDVCTIDRDQRGVRFES